MKDDTVFLIGGAPGVGKTTLGRALAARLGIASVTIDDLMTVAQAVTTPETHPDLHVMKRTHYLDYYTNSSVEQLIADANAQHNATWPFVKKIIEKRATWAPSSIAIDGWHLRPSRVAELNLSNVRSGWIVASPSVLEEREGNNVEWMRDSPDPKRMLENFLARSLWYNELIEKEATALRMDIFHQGGSTSVEEMCDLILRDPSQGN